MEERKTLTDEDIAVVRAPAVNPGFYTVDGDGDDSEVVILDDPGRTPPDDFIV